MKINKVGSFLFACAAAMGCQSSEELTTAAGEQAVAVHGQALQQEVWTSKWNGANASAYMYEPFKYAYVDVWEDNGGNGNRTVSLSFSRETIDPNSEVCEEYCDPWFCGGDMGEFPPMEVPGGECPAECTYSYCYYTDYTYEYGWGQIPESDFRASGNTANLSTSIDENSDFYVETCTITQDDYDCTTGAVSPISAEIAWRKDGVNSYSNNGTSKEKYGMYSYHSHGSYKQDSASASGFLGDIAFEGGPGTGWIGVSRGGSVSKGIYGGGDGDGDGMDPLP